MKLSPAQVSILQGLANGFVLYRGHYTGGGLMPARFRGEARQEYRHAPLDGLIRRKFVKPLPYRTGSFQSTYTITDAGRKALAGVVDQVVPTPTADAPE